MAVNAAFWRKRQVDLYAFEASLVHVIIPGQPGLYSKNMPQNKYRTESKPNQTTTITTTNKPTTPNPKSRETSSLRPFLSLFNYQILSCRLVRVETSII